MTQIFRTVNQVIVATVKLRSDDFSRTTRNPWFSCFLVRDIPISWKS